ncbi:hypothetical protein KIPB_009620 [Kipferlia bialata]|uniref:Amine oxidase domain-containing protein n=1 Tax=Kipferlia bialata TaxID=797122 RepID=A0A9K3D1X0_9EUKA|nr:hypothetical protein KIPB_009620 [Kipferlia bialata]|eukprot:g9620.t1
MPLFRSSMSTAPIAVVGGGIAGLAASITLASEGRRVVLIESHSQLGGLCAFWKRRGYTIDGCVHWMTGAAQDGMMGPRFHDLWHSLGVDTDAATRAGYTVFSPGDYPTHPEVEFGTDYRATRAALKEQFPSDSALIDEYFEVAEAENTISMPHVDESTYRYIRRVGLRKALRMGKAFGNKSMLKEWGARASDPRLARIMLGLYADNVSQSFVPMTLGGLHDRSFAAYHPGAVGLVTGLQERAVSLGVEVMTHSAVEGMTLSAKRQVESLSVRVSRGQHRREGEVTDLAVGGVVWCAPLPVLLSSLSDNGVKVPKVLKTCAHPVDPASVVAIYLCLETGRARIEAALPGIRDNVMGYMTDAVPALPPLTPSVPVEYSPTCSVTCHSDGDRLPETAREDGCVLEVLVGVDPTAYMGVPGLKPGVAVGDVPSVTKQEYKAYKAAVGECLRGWLAEIVTSKTEAREGAQQVAEGLAPISIAVTDVVTPYTYGRYCATTQGMCLGNMGTRHHQHTTKPGCVKQIKNLSVGSTWTCGAGGLPIAAQGGSQAAHHLHKKMGKTCC